MSFGVLEFIAACADVGVAIHAANRVTGGSTDYVMRKRRGAR